MMEDCPRHARKPQLYETTMFTNGERCVNAAARTVCCPLAALPPAPLPSSELPPVGDGEESTWAPMLNVPEPSLPSAGVAPALCWNPLRLTTLPPLANDVFPGRMTLKVWFGAPATASTDELPNETGAAPREANARAA